MATQRADVAHLFLTPEEAALHLGCTPKHVRDLCLQGRLKHQRSSDLPGARYLIPRVEVYRLAGEPLPDAAYEDVSSLREQAETLRALRRVLAEAQTLLAELDG